MPNVSRVIERKNRTLITVASDFKVIDALKVMAENNIGSVIVQDKEGMYMGILTERDYSRKVVLQGKSSTDTPVTEIMSTNMQRVSPADSLEHCMQLMTRDNVRYLPVFKENELVGVISMSDVVKETILMQEETIKHLETYITRQ